MIAAAVLIFGPKRLPELGRSVGRGIRDFKEGVGGVTVDSYEPAPPPAAAAPPAADPGTDRTL